MGCVVESKAYLLETILTTNKKARLKSCFLNSEKCSLEVVFDQCADIVLIYAFITKLVVPNRVFDTDL